VRFAVKTVISIICLSILPWSYPASAVSPELVPDCPRTFANPASEPSEPKVFGMYFTGSSEYFERIDPITKLPVENPASLIGCYFSGTGRSLKVSESSILPKSWYVGVVDRDSQGYFWRNIQGVTWRLTPDFSQNRFITGGDYPYRKTGNLVELSVPFDSKKPDTCQLMEYRQNFSPGFSRKSWLFYGKEVVRYKVVVPTFVDEKTIIDPKQTFDGLEVDKVTAFIRSQSYGKVTLKFDYVALPEKIPGKASDYYEKSWDLMKLAYKSFRKVNPQVDYEGFVVSLPKEYENKDAGFASGMPYDMLPSLDDSKLRLIWMGAAPFNWGDPFAQPWKVLAHEVGHNFGLADLYATENNQESIDNSSGKTIGPFDIMGSLSSKGNEMSFWSRWLLGWLKDSQVACVTDATQAITTSLSPVGENDGKMKGIVVPLSRHTALLIESRRSQGYDSRLLSDEIGLVVYKIDTRIATGAGPIRVISKNNMPTSASQGSIHDMLRFLKAPLQLGESATVDGYTIINTGDSEVDRATIIKGEDPRPVVSITSSFASEYSLTDISIPLYISSSSSSGFEVTSRTPDICKVNQGKVLLGNSGKCNLAVVAKPDSQFKSAPESSLEFTIRDNRQDAIARNIYYEDNSACHASGVGAVLQIFKDGQWLDYLSAQGWNRPSGCPATNPTQPWLIGELPSGVEYRWRFFASGWTTDFFSPTKIAPLTAADAAAKAKADKEAERLAAIALTKANEEARAKAAALAASKKITITCIKGKTIKKVSAVNPKCPAGFKKK
jgi:hypothetical protein